MANTANSNEMVGVLLAISWLIGWSEAVCPQQCRCGPDSRGRRTVFCSAGSMFGPVPVAQMDSNIQTIRITAPENKENYLTMGPIFQRLLRLEEVHITHSNVPSIGKHSFWGVPSLRLLNLTSNNISQVQDHNFRGLVNLLELHLDWNSI
nr:insulin-like growth factor-binding protein complex acid labile subunit [Halyomorpha halys]